MIATGTSACDTTAGVRQRRIVVLCASPRLDGNSRTLAEALIGGAHETGHVAELVQLDEVMKGLLQDCRACRREDGRCGIDDCFEEVVHGQLVGTDAWVYATPLYWYGMSAALKNFFDRLVCYISASYPRHGEVVQGFKGKRVALLLASEERFPTAASGVVFQIQECTRYLHQQFVQVVNGIGNKRGEVRFDPGDSLGAARALGRAIFELHYSDFNIDVVRPNAVWPEARESAYDAEISPYADV